MVSANTKAAREPSIAGNVDPEPDEEENEEDGEASELENNFPPLCLLVLQQGEPEEKASEETEHVSNNAHSAVLLSEPPVEGAAEVEGGEQKDEDELEQPNQLSAKCMRRLCVVQPVDQDHLVLVPVVDRGAEAGGHRPGAGGHRLQSWSSTRLSLQDQLRGGDILSGIYINLCPAAFRPSSQHEHCQNPLGDSN